MEPEKNPFPGINPWMQTAWSDVHTMLIGYIRDALSEELPDDLMARAEERVTLSSPLHDDTLRTADAAVIEPETWKPEHRRVWTPKDDPDLADRVADAVLVEMEFVKPRWVEIRSSKGKLLTVIEVTSPANKTAVGRASFEKKMSDFLAGGVNVMEIDLIRGGQAAKDCRSGNWPPTPNQITVSRADNPTVCEVYPCPLREPLPAVRVPLRRNEPDAALDLQPLIDRCYTRGRYWMLSYDEALKPPLSDEDLTWARTRLKEASLVQ